MVDWPAAFSNSNLCQAIFTVSIKNENGRIIDGSKRFMEICNIDVVHGRLYLSMLQSLINVSFYLQMRLQTQMKIVRYRKLYSR